MSCCAVRIKQSHKVLSNLHGGLKLIRSFQSFGRDLRHPVTGCWLFLKQGWGGRAWGQVTDINWYNSWQHSQQQPQQRGSKHACSEGYLGSMLQHSLHNFHENEVIWGFKKHYLFCCARLVRSSIFFAASQIFINHMRTHMHVGSTSLIGDWIEPPALGAAVTGPPRSPCVCFQYDHALTSVYNLGTNYY